MRDRKPLSQFGPLTGYLFGGAALALVLVPPLGLLILNIWVVYWLLRRRKVNRLKAEIIRKARERATDQRCIAWKSIPNCQ